MLFSVMLDLPMPKRLRAGRLEEPAPYWIRGHPEVVPTPYPIRGKLQSGTISKNWIPVVATRNRAFAGMTKRRAEVNLWTDSN